MTRFQKMNRPGRRNVSLLLLFFILSSTQATSLIQALQNVGASQFAAEIQADPAALAIYLSNRVQTVFAPIDGPTNTSISKLHRRQSSPDALQRLLYHSTANTNTLGSMSSGSGIAMKSNDISPKLGGKSQVFVSTPLSKPKPNICANQALVEFHHWHTIFVPTLVYITVPPTTVFIQVPITEYGTLFITIDDILVTTVVTTVHDTYVATVQTTDFITIDDVLVTTVVTTVHDTYIATVKTTDFITLPITEPTTRYITGIFTLKETKYTTVPTTILTTVLSTVPTTVLTTFLSSIYTTVSTMAPTTILSTLTTEVPTTILSTLSIELSSTIVSTVTTKVTTKVPTMIVSTVSTEVLSTIVSTVTTEVPTTVSTVVSTRLLPTSTPSLVKISSGLGNAVNIIRADILYDGGVIQVVDDYFTLPESLTDTANANGQTAFTGLAKSYNLTDTLDNTPEVTYFIPSNSAFAMEGSTSNYSSIKSLLLGHLIPNFAGYLPSLTNGTTFRSQSGSEFKVKVQGSDYYLNNAKVILSNVIIENGVAHVIDQVIQPSPGPTHAPHSNSSSSFQFRSLQIMAWGLTAFLVSALLM